MLALPLAGKGIKKVSATAIGGSACSAAREATNAEVDQDRERDQVGAP